MSVNVTEAGIGINVADPVEVCAVLELLDYGRAVYMGNGKYTVETVGAALPGIALVV